MAKSIGKQKDGPGLYGLTRRPRMGSAARQLVDYDYLGKLSPADKLWLSRFTDEYYLSASSKGVMGQDDLRERWRANHAARRDCYAQTREDAPTNCGNYGGRNPENTLAELIDASREKPPARKKR